MGPVIHTLDEDIFAVFERACRERQFELANHILGALESIARHRNDARQLELAYLIFVACANAGDGPQGPPGARL